MKSHLRLFRLWLHSLMTRFRYHLGYHLFFAISFITIGSIFFYIFSDFFSDKLPQINQEIVGQANLGFSVLMTILSSITICGLIRSENIPLHNITAIDATRLSLSRWSLRYGESHGPIMIFKTLRGMIITLIIAGGIWFICRRYFSTDPKMWWTFSHIAMSFLAMILGFFWPKKPLSDQTTNTMMSSSILGQHRQKITHRGWLLSQWRRHLLWFHFPVSKTLLRLAIITILLLLPLSFVVSWLELLAGAWLAGLLATYAIYAFEADALRSSSYEKNAGMSHHDYCVALWNVCGSVALIFFGLTLVVLGGSAFFSDQINVLLACKIGTATMIPIISVPCLILQVDGKRPILNTLMTILVSLFCISAILAHFASILVLPVMIIYTWNVGKNRFYRC
ncbi:MAG: hypothetical protein OXC40_07420 [Proteobacteria bacterium]|nr:hypothetical protein [Pseudomonadota bacterium]